VAKLDSDLFGGDRALEAALTVDAAHIARGATGDHVKKIQCALALLLTDPPCSIGEGELSAGRYGERTAAEVLRYKTERGVINFAYQRKPDDIVGKMTMRSLDEAMVAVEADYGAALLAVLGRMEMLLLRHGLTPSPHIGMSLGRIRARAARLVGVGTPRPPGGRFRQAYQDGVPLMDDAANDYRPPIVFAAAPLAAGAGAAITTFLIVVGALIVMLLISEVIAEGGKLGNRVNEAIQDVIDTGERAILENLALVERITSAIDQCKRRSQNPSPECRDALDRQDTKRRETVTKRNELQSIIQQLKSATGGSPKKLVWKLLVKRAEAVAKQLARLEKELRAIWQEIRDKCGCQFIKI
jgi:hypothetical protein